MLGFPWSTRQALGEGRAGNEMGIVGLKAWRGVIRNPRAIRWIFEILEKASWLPPSRLPSAAPESAGQHDEEGRLPTSGRTAELSTVNPEVLAQLLSSALFHMAEESELTSVVRLGPTDSIGPSLLPRCNALLLLGDKSSMVHRLPADGLRTTHVLEPGDLITRRGSAASDWILHVPPLQQSALPARARAVGRKIDDTAGGRREGGSAHNPAPPPRPVFNAGSARGLLQERVCFLFQSEGEWPDDPLWGPNIQPGEENPLLK